ncbi:hypothetical protein HU675_0038340 [Bradyrhizobium septentrionale]|uniref:hypothetical protein n=1 Tax=Bradyrhizobium septentrionale TaxID=1404411 RepID=UPI0015970979|nr:hypothetical protein [Bradyrhizobium septentrionale]UGY23747.1 hypothetical protein HU675_0038340 [Bradyrhizobium septentrionale]
MTAQLPKLDLVGEIIHAEIMERAGDGVLTRAELSEVIRPFMDILMPKPEIECWRDPDDPNRMHAKLTLRRPRQ